MLACLIQPPTYEVFLEDYEQAHAAHIRAVDDFHNFPTGDKSPESYEASYRLGLACDRLNAATDARTARKFSVPAVQWADGEFNCPGRECPEKTILADLLRLSV